MATVQVEQSVASWLELQVLDATTRDPIALITAAQVRVFYKKHGALTFTRLTPLVNVADTADPQAGENFAEVGFGVYAVLFSADELDTAETFTWVVIPEDPDDQDFVQWTQQVDIVPDTDVTVAVAAVDTKVTTLQSDLTDGFDDNTVDLTAIQSTLTDLTNTLGAVQGTVDDIEAAQGDGISVSFVD